jgi:ribosome-associated protein
MVAPLPDLSLGSGLTIPSAELRWRFSRASGPGGQNVNSTDSRVMLLFPLANSEALPPVLQRRALRRLGHRLVDGALQITAQEHRSQWRNRQAAQERLVALLQEAIAPPAPVRRGTRPSRASIERRLAAKRRRAALKGQRRSRPGLPDD